MGGCLTIEVKKGTETVNLPYTIRLYGITEAMFDELTDEDTRAELIDGVMIVHSPASVTHDDVRGLGKVLGPDSLVHLAAGRKCAPDVFFVRHERVLLPLPKEFEGAPDLVVEVLSPSTCYDDLHDKRAIYHAAGVGEIWFVDSELQQVLVDRRHTAGYVEEVITTDKLSSHVLTGFWPHASWLWAEPLPNRFLCLQETLG